MTRPVSIRSVSRLLLLLYFEFSEKLFSKSVISFRSETQNFVSDVRWTGDGYISGFRFLLLRLFLHFSSAVSVGSFGGLPRFAKHRARAFLICIPQNIGDAGLSSSAQSLIAEIPRIGGQRNQQRLSVCAALPNNSCGFGIYLRIAFSSGALPGRCSSALRPLRRGLFGRRRHK